MVQWDWSRLAKVGDSFMVRIPVKVFTDEKFPFKEGDQVLVKIQNDKIVISKEGE